MTNAGNVFININANTAGVNKQVRGLASGIGGLSSAFIALGAAVAAAKIGQFFASSVKDFEKFEQAVTNAASVTGQFGKELERTKQNINDVSKELGKTTVFSASEAANAFYDLASAGYDVSEMTTDELAPVLDLAAATQSDLAFATETVTGVLASFGYGMEQSERVADVFTKTIGSSKATVDKLNASYQYVGASLQQYNVDLEDANAALAVLYNRNLDGSKAGNVLRNVLNRTAYQAGKGEGVLKKYGLSLKDVDVETQGLIPVLKKFEEANISNADAQILFGKEYGAYAKTLIDSTGDIEELTETLQTAGGVAQQVAEEQINTLGGSLKLFTSNLESLKLVIGESLAPAIRLIAEALGSFVSDSGFQDQVKIAITGMADFARQVFTLVQTIAEPLSRAFQQIGKIIQESLADIFSDMDFDSVNQEVSDFATIISDNLVSEFQILAPFVTEAVKVLLEVGEVLVSVLKPALILVSGVLKFIAGLFVDINKHSEVTRVLLLGIGGYAVVEGIKAVGEALAYILGVVLGMNPEIEELVGHFEEQAEFAKRTASGYENVKDKVEEFLPALRESLEMEEKVAELRAKNNEETAELISLYDDWGVMSQQLVGIEDSRITLLKATTAERQKQIEILQKSQREERNNLSVSENALQTLVGEWARAGDERLNIEKEVFQEKLKLLENETKQIEEKLAKDLQNEKLTEDQIFKLKRQAIDDARELLELELSYNEVLSEKKVAVLREYGLNEARYRKAAVNLTVAELATRLDLAKNHNISKGALLDSFLEATAEVSKAEAKIIAQKYSEEDKVASDFRNEMVNKFKKVIFQEVRTILTDEDTSIVDKLGAGWNSIVTAVGGATTEARKYEARVDSIQSKYQSRLAALAKEEAGIKANTGAADEFGKNIDDALEGIESGGSGARSAVDEVSEEMKKLAEQSEDTYREVERSFESQTKAVEDERRAIRELIEEFVELQEEAGNAILDLNQKIQSATENFNDSISNLERGTSTDLAQRFVDIGDEIEKVKEKLNDLRSDEEVDQSDILDLEKELANLQAEKAFIQGNVSDEILNQVQHYNDLTKAERILYDQEEKRKQLTEEHQKELAKLNEQKAIYAALERSAGIADLNLETSVGEDGLLTARYEDEEGKMVEIKDYENILLAQRLANQQTNLQQELDARQTHLENLELQLTETQETLEDLWSDYYSNVEDETARNVEVMLAEYERLKASLREVISLQQRAGTTTSTAGFATGGYTGNGSLSQVAGLVHKGEYVIPNAVLKRLAPTGIMGLLEKMRGFAGGGFTSPVADGVGRNYTLNVNQNVGSQVDLSNAAEELFYLLKARQ